MLSRPLGHCSPADTQHGAAVATAQADANPEAPPGQQQGLAALSGRFCCHLPSCTRFLQSRLLWLGWFCQGLCGSRRLSQGPAAPDASFPSPRGREVPGVPPAVRGAAVCGGGAAAADADDGSHRALLLLDDAAHGRAAAAGAEGGEVLLMLVQPPRGLFFFPHKRAQGGDPPSLLLPRTCPWQFQVSQQWERAGTQEGIN